MSTFKKEINNFAERRYIVRYIDTRKNEIIGETEVKEEEWEFLKRTRCPPGIKRIVKPVLLL